jgi:hypothetical protein
LDYNIWRLPAYKTKDLEKIGLPAVIENDAALYTGFDEPKSFKKTQEHQAMKCKWIYPISALLVGMLLMIPACSTLSGPGALVDQTPVSSGMPATQQTVQEVYSDPFEYCATVGQIDAPDARYTGPMLSDALFNGYLKASGLDPALNYPATFKQMTSWRCMDGRVYACNSGANIPCGSKANTEKTATQAMLDYCAQFPNSSVIPMSITGHSTIYGWYCIQDTPEILNQIDTVDAAGYQSRNWQLVSGP